MALDLERLRADESWNSPNVSTWAEKVRAALADHEGRITTSFKGLYNQITNQIAGSPGGPLQPANTHLTGDYYTLEVNGVFSTSIPELNGQTGGVGDQVISDGTQWLIFSPSTAFLSSQIADTAAGVITFTPSPVSSTPASAASELIRKGESDAGDNAVQGNLDTHIGHTSATDDVHQSRTYADTKDNAHAAMTAAADDVHQTKTYADQQDAAHVAVDGVGGPAVHPQYMLARNIVTYFPWKAAAVQFNGSLTIQHSFNVSGVTNPAPGVYRISFTQGTINGIPITDSMVPVLSIFAPDAAGESVFVRFNPGAPAGSVDIYAFTLFISGQNMFEADYDLGANDSVWVAMLLNIEDPNSDPLPP